MKKIKGRPRIQFQFTLCKNKSFLDGLFEVGGLSPAEVQEQAKEVATDASLGQICVEFGKLVGAVQVPSCGSSGVGISSTRIISIINLVSF